MGIHKMANGLYCMIFLSFSASSGVQAVMAITNEEAIPLHPSAFKSNKMTFEATIDLTDFISQLKRSILFHQMHLHGSNTSIEVDNYTSQLHDQADKVAEFNTRLQQGLLDATSLITDQIKSHSFKVKEIEDEFEKRFNDLSSVLTSNTEKIKKLNTEIATITSTTQLLEDTISNLSSSTEDLKNINYNIAMWKPAKMSSEYGINRQPFRAVDGDVYTYFQTSKTGQKHWSVDLQHNFVVTKVEIVNRGHYGSRLIHAETSVGLSLNDMKVIGQFRGPGTNYQTITYDVDPPTSARYVKVELTSTTNNEFHLAEVRVFGT